MLMKAVHAIKGRDSDAGCPKGDELHAKIKPVWGPVPGGAQGATVNEAKLFSRR